MPVAGTYYYHADFVGKCIALAKATYKAAKIEAKKSGAAVKYWMQDARFQRQFFQGNGSNGVAVVFGNGHTQYALRGSAIHLELMQFSSTDQLPIIEASTKFLLFVDPSSH